MTVRVKPVMAVDGYSLFNYYYGQSNSQKEPKPVQIGVNRWSGSSVPNYRKLISQKGNATSFYQRDFCTVVNPGYFFICCEANK